ncbi:MAG: hypothetical protein K5774_03320 [Clostridia bacterium]|nr:hypothetical protein [Clostridia bacterium]
MIITKSLTRGEKTVIRQHALNGFRSLKMYRKMLIIKGDMARIKPLPNMFSEICDASELTATIRNNLEFLFMRTFIV